MHSRGVEWHGAGKTAGDPPYWRRALSSIFVLVSNAVDYVRNTSAPQPGEMHMRVKSCRPVQANIANRSQLSCLRGQHYNVRSI
jgi:hypothetical protein